MEDLLAARLQMALSLAFHIVFAAIGIAMPVLMLIAEWRAIRSGSPVHEALARHWAKGTAIMFAVGAVSGTVLSFELGMLWPYFMARAGGIIGVPFGLEGFAFFTEAIFLGIYLYGRNRIPRWAHFGSGVLVALAGAASAMFVIIVNGWMNTPRGFVFDPVTSQLRNVDPIAAMLNPAWPPQAVHMLLAAYAATGFGVAGVHALQLLRGATSEFHREALRIAMLVAIPATLALPLSGDRLAKMVAEHQPVKLAAMEGQFRTEARAPLRIGGLPDEEAGETRYALEIPGLLSLLAYGSLDAPVQGLNSFPRDEWPPVAITHVSFQLMLACGAWLLAVSLIWLFVRWRRGRDGPIPRGLLRAIVVAAPLGFLAIEFGWVVTEVGRQPWIIHGVLRVEDSVTPMPGLVVPFVSFTIVYILLALAVIVLMRRQVRLATPEPVELTGKDDGDAD